MTLTYQDFETLEEYEDWLVDECELIEELREAGIIEN